MPIYNEHERIQQVLYVWRDKATLKTMMAITKLHPSICNYSANAHN